MCVYTERLVRNKILVRLRQRSTFVWQLPDLIITIEIYACLLCVRSSGPARRVPVTTTQCIRRATPDVMFICSVADE